MPDMPNSAADGAADPATSDDATAQMAVTDVSAGDSPEGSPERSEAAVAAEPADAATPSVDVVDVEPVTPVPHRRRRSLALRFGVSFVLAFLLAAGVGAGVMYAWGEQYQGRVLPGVRIGGTDLGGLTRDEAATAIAGAYGSLGTGQITLTGPDGHATTISYADVGRGPDTSALLDAALAAGREGEPLADLINGPRTAIRGVTLDSVVAFDRDKVAAQVESIAAQIDQAPTNSSITVGKNGVFSVAPAKEGRAVDKNALTAALEQQLADIRTPASITIPVPVLSLKPAIDTTTADAAKAAAARMTADVTVIRNEDTWTIPGTRLAPLVSFWTGTDGTITPVFDESGLDPLMKALAKDVDRKARDAGLKLVNGRVVATGSSREGRTLLVDGMKATIMSEIRARAAGAASTPVQAVVKAVDPKLSTADAKAYAGKMKMISSYSVFYWVIINNHFGGNIEAPATKINGTVVPAGSVFDFWKVVGDLRKLPGTGPGNAIEGGKITVTGAFGGGICTTSTTLFNAAFRAGMVPMARKNHNEFITRYPPGLDATVWIVGGTKQTMSFKNDTQYPILITRTVTQTGNKRWLTFKIWSVPNGRTYKISNTVIQHGPKAIDTVVYDSTKPVGYTYRNNDPADGAKVWVTVSIYDHGKLHWSKRYFSNYPAVNGVLIKGSKT